jgi:predicted permease
LLTEGVLLALIGGGLGALLAVWGTDLLVASLPKDLLPRVMTQVRVDWRVLLFALCAAIGTGLLFGLAPAWLAWRVDVSATLKESGNKGGTTGGHGRIRGALVVLEVALSLVLLVGAGLLARTFANLLGVAPGFDPRGVLTFQMVLDGPRYDTTRKADAFYRIALEHIRSLPGVEAAAVINKLPLDWQFNSPIVFPEEPDKFQSVQFRMISPDYFRVIKIALRQGRDFNDNDNAASQPVAIVNEAFVKRFVEGQNTFERRFCVGRCASNPMLQVVGVIADVKQMGLDSPVSPMVFVPIPQLSDRQMAMIRTFNPANFTVRTMTAPRGLVDAIKSELSRLDGTVAMSQIATMEEVAARSVAQQRFNMLFIGLFAGLGLLLASVGIYGVVSYAVAQRTHELGIRIALGARGAAVMRLILGHGLALALAGVALGTVASLELTRLMKAFLFGVEATDPPTFVAVAFLLTTVALIACWIPARRATKVDPMHALRSE